MNQMKKNIVCVLLVLLVLSFFGCGTQTQEETTLSETTQTTQQPAETQPAHFTDDPQIAAVWINSGQYSDGHDFIETMSLLSDGSAMIHMDYQGSDYETLFGTYTARQGVLTVYIEADEPYQRQYQYELDANILTLYGQDKTVVYRRSD